MRSATKMFPPEAHRRRSKLRSEHEPLFQSHSLTTQDIRPQFCTSPAYDPVGWICGLPELTELAISEPRLPELPVKISLNVCDQGSSACLQGVRGKRWLNSKVTSPT